MRKFLTAVLIFFLAVAIYLIANAVKESHKPLPQVPSTTDPNTVAENQLQECELFNPFQKAVASIGSIPYNSEFNNCYDHSKELTAALAKQGIYSTIVVNGTRTHAWVAVWIEATNGQFISPATAKQSLFNTTLEVRDGTDPSHVECYNDTLAKH